MAGKKVVLFCEPNPEWVPSWAKTLSKLGIESRTGTELGRKGIYVEDFKEMVINGQIPDDVGVIVFGDAIVDDRMCKRENSLITQLRRDRPEILLISSSSNDGINRENVEKGCVASVDKIGLPYFVAGLLHRPQ